MCESFKLFPIMKPLAVLITTFSLSLLAIWFVGGHWNYIWAGNIAMTVMLLFTAIGHFKFKQGMIMMMPDFISFKKKIVIFTGFIEIGAAISLLIPALRYSVSILLIIFFVLILPANINAALKNVDYQNATYNGNGLSYLWLRIPLQLFFIGWVWYFGLKVA